MIKIKTPQEIEEMKAAGSISKAALRRAGAAVKPGVSTLEIDQLVENFIRLHGATPTFKGYGGFPGSICASVNEQIVHGIPSPQVVLKDGDIISIDTGATYKGWVGDNAWTFYVGNPSDEYKGYGVIRDYVGHGVGHAMHEDPDVRNYGKRGRGVKLQAGMVIAIEPMIAMGTYECSVLANGWTVVTDDMLPAAHYENTVAITEDGPVILTCDDGGPWCEMQGGLE